MYSEKLNICIKAATTQQHKINTAIAVVRAAFREQNPLFFVSFE